MAKILVTGAAGFIGSHIVETFLEHGFEKAVVYIKVAERFA